LHYKIFYNVKFSKILHYINIILRIKMSISYSALNNKRRVTLPSVDSWGQNMGIVPDPPKSITTRRIDKAQDSAALLQMVQESGDRVSECINVYARGVDPMIGVSYSNNGSNAGMNVNGLPRRNAMGQSTITQSFMPYTVARDGAFRPPIVPPQNLLPLSRLPRIWTSSFTNPAFPDFSKKMMFPTMDDKTVGIRKDERMLRVDARPTATFSVNVPLVEPFEITKVIKNPLHTQATTNMGSTAINVQRTHQEFNPSGYIQERLRADINSNPSSSRNVTSLDSLSDIQIRTKDTLHSDVSAPISGYNMQESSYEENARELVRERNLPMYDARTNTSMNIHVPQEMPHMREYENNRPLAYASTNIGRNVQSVDDISSRDYNLRPKISAGEYESKSGYVPVFETGNSHDRDISEETGNIDPRKMQFNKRVYEMQNDRYVDFRDTQRQSPYGIQQQ